MTTALFATHCCHDMTMLLDKKLFFPPANTARPDGLVAVGGDLSAERLLLAYRSGIFPWSANPVTWWSPDPRGIFELDQFHVSRSLDAELRKNRFHVTRDSAFRAVMDGCATGRPEGSWIDGRFIEAYTRLHKLGHAHSVECWKDNELAGGIYGVSLGRFFAGESMFHRVTNASKVALAHLAGHLRERGFLLFDIQMVTPITRQLGAVEISRADYLARLAGATLCPDAF